MNYHNITYPDMNNGEGLRVVLWLSGCSHHCYNCQNPQTWNANSGIPFDESAKKELFRELDKDYISGLTLTGGDPLFESNLDDVLDLVNEIRLSLPNKSIWIYSGYSWEETMSLESELKHANNLLMKNDNSKKILYVYHEDDFKYVPDAYSLRKQIISQCNVMVDGRYVDLQRNVTLKWRGSTNQKVIDIQQSLQQNKVVLYCD